MFQTPQLWILGGVWVVTRILVVSHVGYWSDVSQVQFEDVHTYEVWSNEIVANGALPNEEAWQYPPGAALLMLLPRVGWGGFGDSFVVMMLVFDLAGLVLLGFLGRREGSYAGVWVWLLGMPLLRALPVLRFDLVPTVFGMAALVAIHRRPGWFGALAGLGASLKAWPIVVLLGEWDRRRLTRSVAAALATLGVVFAASYIAFGDQSGFLAEQNGRGLQVESVASIPWHLRHIVTGEPPHEALRFGAWEIESGPADFVAGLLKWMGLAALAAAGLWWMARARAIRRGRRDLTEAAVSRDFVFTVVLLLVVTSRVLSPQYMIWLLGLAAVVLSTGKSRLVRPAWVVIGATILTTSAYGSADNTLIRDLALLFAAIDASVTMAGEVQRDPYESEKVPANGQLG
jgi:Glycosyltransferase family 87